MRGLTPIAPNVRAVTGYFPIFATNPRGNCDFSPARLPRRYNRPKIFSPGGKNGRPRALNRISPVMHDL